MIQRKREHLAGYSEITSRNLMLAMANAPNTGTGRLGLGCVDVSLFKRLDTVGLSDGFLLAAPSRLVFEVEDFFRLEEGIPT